MSATTTPLSTIAGSIAISIRDGHITPDALAQLHSDTGLIVDGAVVWHRTSDDRVVAWAGNDTDPNMDAVIEVPVR